VIVAVEVSDTTFADDLRKVAEYAEVGIPQAWIVDVRRRRVVVHSDPVRAERRYAAVTSVSSGSLELAGTTITIDEIFPQM